MSRKTILLVDDDKNLLRLLSIRLEKAGFDVATAQSGDEALGLLLTKQPQLVITDLRMSGMDGMQLFNILHERVPALPVIILTAHGTIPNAVEATQKGVSGYLTKPLDGKALLACVADTLRHSSGSTSADLEGPSQAWRNHIVSASPIMEELLREVKQVAESDVSVLLQSESGTGKEMLARAMHEASGRRLGPFVAVNCAAIPDQLLESELFGHRKGAFTGATEDRVGLFETATGGTLFLDEIGDMPLGIQSKLLRVLEDKEVRPLGSRRAIPLDVRILSATHKDLEQAVRERDFRDDLYYRLNVIMLRVPPLAERREDIPVLASHFLVEAAKRMRKSVHGFSREATEMLLAAPWPGNVRQLRNVVEQVVVLTRTPIVSGSLVQRALRGKTSEITPMSVAQSEFEREYLVRIMRTTRGNVAQAARLAKRNRTDFYKLLHRYHLQPDLFRPDPPKQ